MQVGRAWRNVWMAITLGTMMLGAETSLAAPVGTAAPLSIAPNSRLPHPKDADVWVDGMGILNQQVAGVPGGQPGFVSQVSFLVFSPKHGSASIENLIAWSASHAQLLAPTAPVLKLAGPSSAPISQPGSEAKPAATTRETYVFRTHQVGRFAVLGTIRNPQPTQQLAFVVLMDGRLDPVQAAAQAAQLVDQHIGEALRRRQGPPLPSDATAARPAVQWEGMQLQQLLQSILTDPTVSPRAKEMARTVIPNAATINYSMWKMPQPMSDSAFFEFYLQQGQRLGWGAPLSQDQTVPGNPALLFKRPSDDGYVMIQARTPLVTAPATQPTTYLIILDISATPAKDGTARTKSRQSVTPAPKPTNAPVAPTRKK